MDGGDAINRTPNIYLQINFKKGIEAYIVARDSENKKKYFEKLASQLNGYEPNASKTIWKKKLSETINNLTDVLDNFIKTDKSEIDNILLSTIQNIEDSDFSLLEDEYSSKFGFISEEQFYKLKSRVEAQNSKLKREGIDIVKNSGLHDNLPIAIVSISIENFQGVQKAELEKNLPTNAKWIFLTGENGFGKTSVLQAIALGLTNYDENREYIKEKAKIDVAYKREGEFLFNSSAFSFNEEFKSLNKNFIAYGPLRLNTQASSTENKEHRTSSNIYNLFNKDGVLKNISYLFKISRLKNNSKEYDNLRNAVIQILDSRIADISIDEDGEMKYYEADGQKNILGVNRLENLATGFQSLINLTGDIISRFSKEFPTYNYSDYEGIILIDELENHLHPIFQKKIPRLLSNIFPKIQFVASVHSPIPLLGAPVNSIILKVNRDAEKQITIERIIIDNIETLTPNVLFTSPIFGFSAILSNNLVEKDKLRTEDTWEEVKANDDLDKELLSLYNARTKNK